MKEQLSTALVQFSPWPIRESEKNKRFILAKVEELANKGTELIVFPEMSLTNFFEHGAMSKEEYWEFGTIEPDGPEILSVVEAAKQNNCYVIIGFAERSENGEVYNSALLTGPDGKIGTTRKLHFPGLEKLYYSTTNEIPVFTTPIGKIGISICYDSFFSEYPRALALKGAEIIVMPSSIWSGGGKGGIGNQKTKKECWDSLPIIRAIENQVFVIACNGGGTHYMSDEVGTWERLGLSKIISPSEGIMAQATGSEETILTAVLKQEDLRRAGQNYSFLSDRIPAMYRDLTHV